MLHINFTNRQRIWYSKIIICLTLLAIMAISYKVWLTDRNYPLAPILEGWPTLPAPLDYLQLVAMGGLLMLCIFLNTRWVFVALFILFWFLVAGDQNRLQPYNYQFIFMLLVIGAWSGKKENEESTLNILRLILIGTYLWLGIHKINMNFIDRFYPFVAGSKYTLPGFEPGDTLRKYTALFIPFTEIFIGLGLMFNRTRNLALHLVVFMHLVIAVFLSPVGYGWNVIVIPWNIGLAFVNILLFWKVPAISFKSLWMPRGSWLKIAVIVLFIIMPFFNLFGWWDHYLSFSVYSFKTKYGAIYIPPELKQNLPLYLTEKTGKHAYIQKNDKGEYIECMYWAMGELNITPYPEKRVFEQVRDYICTFDPEEPCRAELVLYN